MLNALAAFAGLFLQSVFVFGLFFWIPCAAILAGLVWTFVRAEPIPHWKLSLLALLPAIWIFVGLWGGYFWRHSEPNPEWVLYPLRVGIWVFSALAIGLIVCLREARWFVLLFILLNFYFMLAMTMLASMAVTGDWL
jgi:hypothetical protein